MPPESRLEQSGQSADDGFDESSTSGHSGCPEKSWIAIRLIGEDGAPVAGEPYSIELPDGRTVEGKLDRNGTAEIRDIEPGTCKVTLPNMDEGAWVERKAVAAPAGQDAPPPSSSPTAVAPGGGSDQSADQPEEEAPAEDKPWVSIKLLGVDESPARGARYSVELPDGQVIEGALDDDGQALIESEVAGTCKVTFPDLDKEAWDAV